MKPVAILGIGPAGLAAAHACRLAGVPFALFSRDLHASRLGGAQFLHRPLPLVNDEAPDFKLLYTIVGTADIYKEKVYGNEPVPFVSFKNQEPGTVVPAWSLPLTYERLFEELVGTNQVNQADVNPYVLNEWQASGDFAFIVSSVPKPAICRTHYGFEDGRAHLFVSQTVRIMNESVLGTSFDNTIIYDGTHNVSWYRTSRINGVGSTEWGEGAPEKLPYEEPIVKVSKPIRTDCTCWQNAAVPVINVGRFGTWSKGELVHNAFIKTWEKISAL